MSQASQDVALALEALLARAADQAGVQELDRGQAFEPPVATIREPHAAHAPLTNQREQRVRADRLAGQRRRRRRLQSGLSEKTFLRESATLLQQSPEVGGQR